MTDTQKTIKIGDVTLPSFLFTKTGMVYLSIPNEGIFLSDLRQKLGLNHITVYKAVYALKKHGLVDPIYAKNPATKKVSLFVRRCDA
jgi:hypothetical protein